MGLSMSASASLLPGRASPMPSGRASPLPLDRQFLPGQQLAAPPPPLSPKMVDPAAIDKQRQRYAQALAARMKEESQGIAKRVQLEKKELAQRAALEKKNYEVVMDQFVQQQALAM